MVWVLLIAGAVQLFAYWLYKVGSIVLEDEHAFHAACVAFFVIFISAAVTLSYLIPDPAANASFKSLVQSMMSPAAAAE